MVPATGIEPVTLGSEDQCSNPLSYAGTRDDYRKELLNVPAKGEDSGLWYWGNIIFAGFFLYILRIGLMFSL